MLILWIFFCNFFVVIVTQQVVIVGNPNFMPVQTSHEVVNTTSVQISCRPKQMCITIEKIWLEEKWSIDDSASLGLSAQCNSSTFQTSTHLTLCTKDGTLLSCGTVYEQNDTHVIYSNNVTMNSVDKGEVITNPGSIFYNRWFRWRCIFPIRLMVGVQIRPQISPVTHFLGRQTGTGEFQVIMLLYKDDDYKIAYQIPPYLAADDRVRVEVMLIDGPSLTKLQVHNCWATPEQSAQSQVRYSLIENYCPISSEADVSMIANGEAMSVKWESKVFRFVNYTRVYLHCNVRLCFDDSNTECSKPCNPSVMSMTRKRRDVVDDDIVVSLGPIQPYNDVFLVSASNIIENYIIKKSNDVTTFPSRFIRPHNKLWGLSKEGVIAFSVVLAFFCCIILVIAAGWVIWKRRMRSSRVKMPSNFARTSSTEVSTTGSDVSDPPYHIQIIH